MGGWLLVWLVDWCFLGWIHWLVGFRRGQFPWLVLSHVGGWLVVWLGDYFLAMSVSWVFGLLAGWLSELRMVGWFVVSLIDWTVHTRIPGRFLS